MGLWDRMVYRIKVESDLHTGEPFMSFLPSEGFPRARSLASFFLKESHAECAPCGVSCRRDLLAGAASLVFSMVLRFIWTADGS